MSLIRLYIRVLGLLGKEARLGWILAGANLLLAGAQFAEPVLVGRIGDVLSGKAGPEPQTPSPAWPFLAAWAALAPVPLRLRHRGPLPAARLAPPPHPAAPAQ